MMPANAHVLLLGLNARPAHSNPSLYYLREYCRDLPLSISISDEGIGSAEAVLDRISAEKPDILGISVYIWNSSTVKRILPEIPKRIPGCTIVLGGPEVSYNAVRWLSEFPEIGHIVTGPGERSFRALLEHGAGGRIIPGDNPPFAEIPFPYTDDDFRKQQGRVVYYEASRGCPFRCTYCLSSREDLPLERRGIGQVKKEIEYLAGRGARIIKFVDRSFNSDADFAREIWRFLISRRFGTPFHFEVHPGLLSGEDYALLSSAPPGYFQFELGIQSTHETTLREIKRPVQVERVRGNVERLSSLGNIRLHLDMIAGLPFDDMSSIGKTFDQVYALKPEYFQLGFLKVLPGTEIHERSEEYGLVHSPDPPYRIISNRWLTEEDLKELKRIDAILNALRNGGRFRETLAFLEGLYPSPFGLYRALAASAGRFRDGPSLSRELVRFIDRHHPGAGGGVRSRLRSDGYEPLN